MPAGPGGGPNPGAAGTGGCRPPQGDQRVEEGRGQGPRQPVVEVQLEAVGDRLDQALEPDLDPGGEAEEQAQDPQACADQGVDAGGVTEEDRPGDAVAPGRECAP